MNITPGTWIAKYDENLESYEVSGLGGGSAVALIAKHDIPDEELENAALIAAAPELLKELKHIERCCIENAKNSKGIDKRTYKELAEIAGDAILKALAKEKINKPKPMSVDNP